MPIEVLDHSVVTGIEIDRRRSSLAFGVEEDAHVGIEDVGIRADRQEISGMFDRGEAITRNAEGLGFRDHRDRGTHRGFELIDGRRGRDGGIQGLGVSDQREGEDAVVGVEDRAERREVKPKIVGIEEAVALDILEGLDLFGRTLGGFTQEDLSVGASGEMASLFVGFGAFGDFHQEGDRVRGEIADDPAIQDRTEVVGIGDEGVEESGVEHPIQKSGRQESGVEIAVTGWTPRQIGVFGRCRRPQTFDEDLGDTVLQKIQRQAALREVILPQDP